MPIELTCGGEYGRAARRRRIGRVALTESVYAAREVIPSHYHSGVQLCLVLEGGYEERFTGTTLRCGPATLLLHRPGEVHSDHFSDAGGRCLNVALADGLLAEWGIGDASDRWPASRQGVPGRDAFELRRRLWEREPPSPDDVEELVVALLGHLDSGPAFTVSGAPPPWLEAVHARVHEEFRASPSLDDLAAEAGVHRVHVARTFRRHFGCTVGEYARRRRVEFACARLLQPDAELGAVAYAAGFADQAHFTRVFRHLVGATPGDFRRRFGRADVS